MQKTETISATSALFLTLIVSLIITFGVNKVSGPDTVTYGEVFLPTLLVIGVLVFISNVVTMYGNSKIEKASEVIASETLGRESEDNVDAASNKRAALRELKSLYDEGLIDEGEFERKKSQILDDL